MMVIWKATIPLRIQRLTQKSARRDLPGRSRALFEPRGGISPSGALRSTFCPFYQPNNAEDLLRQCLAQRGRDQHRETCALYRIVSADDLPHLQQQPPPTTSPTASVNVCRK